MKEDEDMAKILEEPNINLWYIRNSIPFGILLMVGNRIGENRHVMSYPIASGSTFNLVLSHIDRSDPSTWSEKYVKEDLLAELDGWDPRYTSSLSL